MWKLSTLAAFLVVLVPLRAFPSSELAREYLFGRNYDCAFNGNCEFPNNRHSRTGALFDSLSAGKTFGLAKRFDPFRLTEESVNKRKAALDSLVAGGMFGKAKKNDYDPDVMEKFQRNVRPLNTMELGGSFGRAVKRYTLDSLGNNAFGVEKRKGGNASKEEEVKAFPDTENRHRQLNDDVWNEMPEYYTLKAVPT